LPKRLCKTQAVIDLGYPYEEEVCSHKDNIIEVSNKTRTILLLLSAPWRRSTSMKS
jgi:hypothetical protein